MQNSSLLHLFSELGVLDLWTWVDVNRGQDDVKESQGEAKIRGIVNHMWYEIRGGVLVWFKSRWGKCTEKSLGVERFT